MVPGDFCKNESRDKAQKIRISVHIFVDILRFEFFCVKKMKKTFNSFFMILCGLFNEIHTNGFDDEDFDEGFGL